ncbi:MAG: Asp-tRNA(Asn)/Glu-tRNA(Gln) amidotransferase subunit GatB [Deltaproteobacteria bacterium]|nr:Asp-tRNA(Asn)/Glu-tRNA(Gln) amidotransferase subunit GatB [Deltaproteobacteria bacterium]
MSEGGKWVPVIGLEIHAQLASKTKMFCGCAWSFGAPPNTQVCPVCLGLPGSLPVPNRQAVRLGLRAAQTLGCRIHEDSTWSRKNYFYPDLPKGYQITQFLKPLATGGRLTFEMDTGPMHVNVIRLHLEEDSGKTRRGTEGEALIDHNRCGVPLAEIVLAPTLSSPAQAAACLRAIRDLLVEAGVCRGNLAQGDLRCDANLSLRPEGSEILGTRCELKNMNSYRLVEKALASEMRRQAAVLDSGQAIHPETRGYDSAKDETFVLRAKEGVAEYHYIDEPDLPPLVLEPGWMEEGQADLPETGGRRRVRLMEDFGLGEKEARLMGRDSDLAEFFAQVMETYGASEEGLGNRVARFVANHVLPALGERGVKELPMSARDLADLLWLMASGRVTDAAARGILTDMLSHGGSPKCLADGMGVLDAVSQDPAETETAIEETLEAHPKEVERYRQGKTGLLDFFMAETLKSCGPGVDAGRLRELIKKKLGSRG